MDIVLRTGFMKIYHSISFQPTSEEKGKKLVLANHVFHVEEFKKQDGSNFIRAKVIRQASIHQKPYDVTIHLDVNTRHMGRTVCTCVYSQSRKCKHLAAVIYFVNNQESLSKTDFEQQWGKPSAQQFCKEKYSKGRSFEEMYPPSASDVIKSKSCHLDMSKLIDNSPLKKLFVESKKSKTERAVQQLLDEITLKVDQNLEKEKCLLCVQYLLNSSKKSLIFTDCEFDKIEPNLIEIYTNNIVIDEQDIIELCCLTINQSSNQLWYSARKLRLSASSNIHSIKTQSSISTENLVNNMLEPKAIQTASITHGLRHENTARKEYEKTYNCTVQEVGVFVSPNQPWLCASLDGVVYKDGVPTHIVELKSSHKCAKNKLPVISENKINVDYLCVKDGNICLKKTYRYYTQCQMQMYLSGFNKCDLYTYSPYGSYCVQVKKDEQFLKKVVLKSEKFYFNYYLPALAKSNVLKKKNAVKIANDRCFTGLDISNNLPTVQN